MALLQPDKAIYHHPLNTATEAIKSEAWTRFTADFSSGKVSNALFRSAFGTEAEFLSTGTTSDLSVTALSATSFVVVYRDNPDGGHGTAKVGTLTGSEIAFGTETEFTSSAGQISAVALSSTLFVVVYQNNAASGRGTAKIGTVSGTDITFGAGTEFLSVDFSNTTNTVSKLSATLFVVAYVEVEESNRGTAKVGTVSGTDITFGAGAAFVSDVGFVASVAALSATLFVVAYRDAADSNHGTAKIGSVSGTNITFGAEAEFTTSVQSGRLIATVKLSATSFVVAYQDNADVNHGTAKVGTVSGTDIAFGTEAEFLNLNGASNISVAALSATSFVVAYKDGADAGHGTAKIGTVSGTDIAFGVEVEFQNTGIVGTTSVSVLSATSSFVVAYQDIADSSHGTAKVGSLPVGASLTGTGASYDSVIGSTKLAYTGWLKNPSV